ncbi:restriction endonuclease subunit S [Colwelliaceae bacterium BS250]
MEKYTYKPSGIEWLGDIPEHWKRVRLVSLGSFTKGSGISKSEIQEEGLPAILYGDIYTKYDIKTDSLKNKISKKTALKSTEIFRGDLLLTGSGETKEEIGKCVVYDSDEQAFAGGDIIIFRPDRADSLFLSFVLNSASAIYQKVIYSKGDIVVHIYGSKLRNVYFPIPSVHEQKVIAEYLVIATAKLDRIIAIKQEQLEKIEDMKKSKIFNACTHGLNPDVKYNKVDMGHITKYPIHWKFARIKRGCERIDTGKTPSTSEPEYFIDGTIEWYAPESFNDGLTINKPKKLINERAVLDNQIKIYPKNSIFFVGVGATAGKVGIIRKPSSCNQQVNILQTNFKLVPEYLAYQLKIIEKEVIKFAQYTTLPILNQTRTGYLQIVYPPKNEQKEIVEYLDNYLSKLTVTKNKIVSQIGTLQAYRKSLIHECVTGKKQVTEIL